MKNTMHPVNGQAVAVGRRKTDTQNPIGQAEQMRTGGPAPLEEGKITESTTPEAKTAQVLTGESTRQIWANKLLFTLISLKFWGLVASMAVTTRLLVHRYEGIAALAEKGVDPQILENLSIGITGAQWITFNVTIWTMLYGIKEVRKVADRTKQQEAVDAA